MRFAMVTTLFGSTHFLCHWRSVNRETQGNLETCADHPAMSPFDPSETLAFGTRTVSQSDKID